MKKLVLVGTLVLGLMSGFGVAKADSKVENVIQKAPVTQMKQLRVGLNHRNVEAIDFEGKQLLDVIEAKKNTTKFYSLLVVNSGVVNKQEKQDIATLNKYLGLAYKHLANINTLEYNYTQGKGYSYKVAHTEHRLFNAYMNQINKIVSKYQ